MATPPIDPRRSSSPTDSPWFWLMMFSAVGLVALVAMLPKYGRRQGRLELKYHAEQEIARRQPGEVPGSGASRDGAEAPPPAGQRIVTLWPIGLVLTLVSAISAAMYWRSRRAGRRAVDEPPPRVAP
jgi:hypothetical protein